MIHPSSSTLLTSGASDGPSFIPKSSTILLYKSLFINVVPSISLVALKLEFKFSATKSELWSISPPSSLFGRADIKFSIFSTSAGISSSTLALAFFSFFGASFLFLVNSFLRKKASDKKTITNPTIL